MTDAATFDAPAEPTLFDQMVEDEELVLRWLGVAADLRFFVTCYLAGLFVFLVMLS